MPDRVQRSGEIDRRRFHDGTIKTVARLAIVSGILDGQVISAPTIQAARFERDQVSISGNFDQAEAEKLAATLNG